MRNRRELEVNVPKCILSSNSQSPICFKIIAVGNPETHFLSSGEWVIMLGKRAKSVLHFSRVGLGSKMVWAYGPF